MSLMERVATLVRANVNDLIDRAEDPGKLAKQLALDMENQMVQVKTQLAIALADQHVLQQKEKETAEQVATWRRKAELALGKADEELARAALERSVVQERIGAQIAAQLVEVKAQVEQLKGALGDLRHKVDEVRAKSELLVARQRRARAAVRSSTKGTSSDPQEGLRRMEAKVRESEAIGKAEVELAAGDMDDRLERLEMEDRVERLLEEMRQRRSLPVHGTDAPGG